MTKSCATTDRSVIPTSTADIRKRFLTYFALKEHQTVPSSSLLPADDDTLMFVNAGMFQFKDTFLGKDKRAYVRAASSQKCVRAGGKHNDLENVGYTARHHTFFEMLGNFSFGDYFKREAIQFAWEFLTEELKIPKEKLWVTVYTDDDEAADIWINEIGVPKDRLSRLGEKDNFWSMGDTGPCGPCSEIFYDHGEAVPGGPPGSPDDDLDRYIEIWNLVFMQYNRFADGRMEPLPKPSVDTGMGLERIAAVMQKVHSNYEIDIFQNLIKAAAKETNTTDLEHRSLRVIADHIRASTFLIADGVMPSADEEGYVLRKIIRRAITKGYLLGQKNEFLSKLVNSVVVQMGDAYPYLAETKSYIEKTIRKEGEQFSKTLASGIRLLKGELSDERLAMKYVSDNYRHNEDWSSHVHSSSYKLSGEFGTRSEAKYGVDLYGIYEDSGVSTLVELRNKLDALAADSFEKFEKLYLVILKDKCPLPENIRTHIEHTNRINPIKVEVVEVQDSDIAKYKVLSGKAAFYLKDTLGFPIEVSREVARDYGFSIDDEGYKIELEKQKERSRAASNFGIDYNTDIDLKIKTQFNGYDSLDSSGQIKAILVDGELVDSISAEDVNDAVLVLDNTSFYAEGGGQVGDIGQIEFEEGLFIVSDTKKQGDAFLHIGSLEKGTLLVGNSVATRVDSHTRNATIRNHSATHLMHAALRNILGEHVQQKGSLVDSERLRFDFSHYESVSDEQLRDIENSVNEQIRLNVDAQSDLMTFDDAIASGALAFFDEKYGDKVRVLKFGDYSTELCGGTHVNRIGDIGFFKITSESGIAAGVRRIEAVTGQGALQWAHNADDLMQNLASQLKTNPAELTEKVQNLIEKQRAQDKELKQLKAQLTGAKSSDMLADAVDVNGVKVLAATLDGADANAMRDAVDQIKHKLGEAVVVLASATEDGKVRLVAGVTKATSKKVQAGKLINVVAQAVGGKGGGRPDMAMAGGTDASAIPEALALVVPWVQEELG